MVAERAVTVLLADEDKELLEFLGYALRRAGFEVEAAQDGEQAIRLWIEANPDVVVTETNLRKLDGFAVCQRIRAVADTPIIALSGASDEGSIVRAFEAGANDYVTKPFSARELIARLTATARRLPRRQRSGGVVRPKPRMIENDLQSLTGTVAERGVRVGPLGLNPLSHQAVMDDVPLNLTPLEFRILFTLAQNRGQVVPHEWLVRAAWGYPGENDSHLAKIHISNLRSKLSRLLNQEQQERISIKAVYGVGYTLILRDAASSRPTRGQGAPISASKAPSTEHVAQDESQR
jgi:DNA-binding response OmpR family regulator